MPESEAHKRAKAKAAGKAGKQKVPLRGGKKLDATRKDTAIEVVRSGRLKAAARRLKISGKAKMVLQVPLKDMAKAREALRNAGIGGTVKTCPAAKFRKSVSPNKNKPRWSGDSFPAGAAAQGH